MNEMPSQANGELNTGLGEVHRFGSASESLFRRLYLGLNRRQQLEEELRRQRAMAGRQAAQQESLQRRYQQLMRDHGRRASELERLQAVLGSLDEGIITQDLNGKVTMMNQAAEAMLGGKKAFWDSALGTLFERYRHVQETRAELTPLGESDEMPINNRIARAQLIAIGDENRRRIGTVIILRDVTYDALAERLKDGFARHIADDMDRPISVIKLAAELLSGQPEDSAVNQQLLEKLLNNVDILDQLALELRDIGRIDAGSFEVRREALSAEAIVWSVVNGIGAGIKSRGIDLLVMTRDLDGVNVRGDDARLQWAMGHLVRNGADYNQAGGYVALAARSESRNGAQFAVISVSDNGRGIPPDELPHIFERFYRGANLPDARRLGQGLYVAKAICEAHGGYLNAQSREGVGSLFTMGVPVFPGDSSAR